MKKFIALVLLGLAWSAAAHAALYYEFNPDYSQSLLVASSETVSELFLPLNDFLGALDFWISNNSTAGNATFTLYNATGSAIAEKTIAVPALADTAPGTRVRVNLPAQLAVTGNTAYRVRIATAAPSFRLYYADQTQLLAHNGVPLPAYTGGLARIGNDDMGFSFKFALHENKEIAPPQLTAVTVSQQNPNQATLTFNANEPVDRRMQYGSTTLDFLGQYTSCAPAVQVCSVLLAVTPNTTYSYTLTVKDVWDNQSSATGTFTSLDDGQAPTPTPTGGGATTTPTPTANPSATPDTVAPSMTNVRIVTLTATTASFAWTTSEAANSFVVVQSLPVLINEGANNDNTLELEHFIRVSNLTPDTYFRAFITSFDAVGNVSSASIDFLTPVVTSSPAPTSSVAPTPSSTPIVSGPQDNTQIAWSAPPTGPPSDGYRIDVFDAANNLIKTITVPAGQLSAALGELPEGENRVVIYGNNDGVFEKVAAPTTVSMQKQGFLERLLSLLPYLLGGIVLIILVTVGVMKLRKPKTPVAPGRPASTPTTPAPPMQTKVTGPTPTVG